MIGEKTTTKWDGIIAGLPEESLPVAEPPLSSEKQEDVIIDVAHWLSRATFDVIGLAGFDYAFHALEDESEEVYSAYIKNVSFARQTRIQEHRAVIFSDCGEAMARRPN